MNSNEPERCSWYVQSDGRVMGPYSSAAVRQLLLRDQIALDDLVSTDRQQWKPVRLVHEVVPPELRNAKDSAWRAPETKHKPLPYIAIMVFVLLFGGIIGFALWWGGGSAELNPNCDAAPGPAVDWRNCRLPSLQASGAELRGMNASNALLRSARLSGADLSSARLDYADLSNADLAYALLSGASLRGADLRGADLSNADLTRADLSYADLRGALLDTSLLQGAIVKRAIWRNGESCAEDSVGDCRVATE